MGLLFAVVVVNAVTSFRQNHSFPNIFQDEPFILFTFLQGLFSHEKQDVNDFITDSYFGKLKLLTLQVHRNVLVLQAPTLHRETLCPVLLFQVLFIRRWWRHTHITAFRPWHMRAVLVTHVPVRPWPSAYIYPGLWCHETSQSAWGKLTTLLYEVVWLAFLITALDSCDVIPRLFDVIVLMTQPLIFLKRVVTSLGPLTYYLPWLAIKWSFWMLKKVPLGVVCCWQMVEFITRMFLWQLLNCNLFHHAATRFGIIFYDLQVYNKRVAGQTPPW